MLVKSVIYHSGRAKVPCTLARTSRNSSSCCFVSSFLFSFSLPSKSGTATKIFDKKTRSRSSWNLRTWWNRRRRRRQFSFVAVNDSLSKMCQGSETAEGERQSDCLSWRVFTSLSSFSRARKFDLTAKDAGSSTRGVRHRERDARVWVKIRGKEQRTCARGGERRHLQQEDLLWRSISTLLLSSVLWIL